jgi:uncharacterized phage protein (TIGR02220 family)
LIRFPYFRFFVNDWLQSEKIAFMTHAQVGAYIMLLAKCWTQETCTLPGDRRLLQALIHWQGTDEDFRPVLACFDPTKKPPGRLSNPRLMKEWTHAHQLADARQRSGQIAAQARWAAKPSKVRPLANGRDYVAESKEVLTFLNEKTHKQFREVDATLGFIQARLKSGVDVQTCRTLIMRKIHDWKEKPDMQMYLRPETLFNKTKFEGYLAEVTK